jgi:hypothetical protein
MGQMRWRAGIWAAPVAWIALAALLVRLGRAEPVAAAVAAAVALLGCGAGRAVAASRGGVAGRIAEWVLLGCGVAWVLAEPAWQRTVVALVGATVSAALSLVAVWPLASPEARHRLAVVAASCAGLLLVPGVAGAPWWALKALAVVLSAAVTARLLSGLVPPLLAVAAVVAMAAAIGPAHTLAWLLPPLVVLALRALASRNAALLAGLAVVAAALPPAGLAASLGLLAGALRVRRSPLPLLALVPAAAVAWWRLPAAGAVLLRPDWSSLESILPLSPAALPLLLPAVALGLAARTHHPADGRDVLAVGLLVLPLLAPGPWTPAVAASLWLTALPAVAAAGRISGALARTLPWSLAAGATMLVLSPWGGGALLGCRQPWLTAGWAVALLATLVPHRGTRLAWVLPALGLLWVLPVEGRDRTVAPGQELTLAAPASGAWVLLVGAAGAPEPRPLLTPVLEVVEGTAAPLVAGRDWPLPDTPCAHPLKVPDRTGRQATAHTRALVRRDAAGATTVRATHATVLRAEDAGRWLERRRRLYGLLGGALVVLLVGHLVAGASHRPLDIATTVLLAALVAAGSAVEPLALGAARAAPDAAAAVLLATWLALLPVLGRRRLLAAALLLVPLALAQPLLRPAAGDEVYHLELIESLRHDHDLDLSNNLDPGDPEQAAYLVYGRKLIHSPLLAAATLPGSLLLGHGGALALVALMMAGGLALAARRGEDLNRSQRTVTAAFVACLATFPALTFASQLWPAAAAVLVVGLLLRASARGARAWIILGAAGALLIKVRLGLLTLPMAMVAALRRGRRGLSLLVVALVAVLAMVALVLGRPLGRHGLAELLPTPPWQPMVALWGLLWDSAGGLALAAPLWLAGLVFLPALWRRAGAGERSLIVGLGLTVAVLAMRSQGEWFGGGSPPARYLVPALPLILLGLAEALRRRRGRRLLGLLVPWAAVAAWVAATRPLWLFNPADGGWWLADRLAPALAAAARHVFPSLIRPGPAALAVPLLLLASALWWTRRCRRGAAAMTVLGLVVVVAVTAFRREAVVHAEDPQVRHRGGVAEPPSGTMNRAAHGIAWRLAPGDEIVVPWRAPLGSRLEARVRLEGGQRASGRLLASWQGGRLSRRPLRGRHWQQVELPRPLALGRGWLTLRWQAAADDDPVALLVDRLEAAP